MAPAVIDCGDGVARQMAFAGVPLASLRHVFITHQPSDHTADYGNLIWLAWTAGAEGEHPRASHIGGRRGPHRTGRWCSRTSYHPTMPQ